MSCSLTDFHDFIIYSIINQESYVALLLEWARHRSCCPERQDEIWFQKPFWKERITEYCLCWKKQSQYQTDGKPFITAKILNTNCYLMCLRGFTSAPWFLSNVRGMVFNGIGQPRSSWDMDLIPYLCKQKSHSLLNFAWREGRDADGDLSIALCLYLKKDGKSS